MKAVVTKTYSSTITIDVSDDVEYERRAVVALDEACDYSNEHNWVDDGTTFTVELS